MFVVLPLCIPKENLTGVYWYRHTTLAIIMAAILNFAGDVLIEAGSAYRHYQPYQQPVYNQYNQYNQYDMYARPEPYQYGHPQYNRYHGGRPRYVATETYRVVTRQKKVRYVRQW